MLIIYFIIAIIAFICIEEIAERIYMCSYLYKKTLGGVQNFRYGVPDGLEIVNIGSGPALHAISYEDSPQKGFNFGTAPQSYYYGFKILEHYKDKIKKNAIVIIAVMCPLSFGNNLDYKRKGYSDKFYGTLSPSEIYGYSGKRAFILRHPLALKIASKIKSKVKTSKTNASGTGNSGVISVWKHEFKLKDLMDGSQADRHKEAFAEKIRTISEGIEVCRANGWRPVFVITPVPSQTRKFISEDFLERFIYDNIKVLKDKYSDIQVFDYYSDERFAKSEMYANDIFMNNNGKKVFSAVLLHDVSEYFKEK